MYVQYGSRPIFTELMSLLSGLVFQRPVGDGQELGGSNLRLRVVQTEGDTSAPFLDVDYQGKYDIIATTSLGKTFVLRDVEWVFYGNLEYRIQGTASNGRKLLSKEIYTSQDGFPPFEAYYPQLKEVLANKMTAGLLFMALVLAVHSSQGVTGVGVSYQEFSRKFSLAVLEQDVHQLDDLEYVI